jgi:hypothetical protein
MSIETLRNDKITEVIGKANNSSEMLIYVFQLAVNVIKSKPFRFEVLNIILTCYENKQKSFNDYELISKIYVLLKDADKAMLLLLRLVQSK